MGFVSWRACKVHAQDRVDFKELDRDLAQSRFIISIILECIIPGYALYSLERNWSDYGAFAAHYSVDLS